MFLYSYPIILERCQTALPVQSSSATRLLTTLTRDNQQPWTLLTNQSKRNAPSRLSMKMASKWQWHGVGCLSISRPQRLCRATLCGRMSTPWFGGNVPQKEANCKAFPNGCVIFWFNSDSEMQTILNDMTGQLRPGEMVRLQSREENRIPRTIYWQAIDVGARSTWRRLFITTKNPFKWSRWVRQSRWICPLRKPGPQPSCQIPSATDVQ